MNTEKIALDIAPRGIVLRSADMSSYTTFRVGGSADFLVYPHSIEDAAALVRYAKENAVPLTVIGGGSNLVIGDNGIRGIVIRMSEDKLRTGRIEQASDSTVYVEAIAKKRDLIEYAVSHGYGDCEFMVGIPGCVGGGIIMNAGTFMGNFIDILRSVTYIDHDGNICEMSVDRTMGHYRGIDFPDACIIWGAHFSFSKKGDVENLRRSAEEIAADRRKKHPQNPSAGSVFKNPEGHFSWKLVNDAGLKGKKIGGAMVSELHTNFIINDGGASAADIRALIALVRSTVKDAFGVELHPEVRMIGEE
ncbi:MAG: UDP-N-acetylmuramate dehydrogenase [Spirochaetota bacterium]